MCQGFVQGLAWVLQLWHWSRGWGDTVLAAGAGEGKRGKSPTTGRGTGRLLSHLSTREISLRAPNSALAAQGGAGWRGLRKCPDLRFLHVNEAQ